MRVFVVLSPFYLYRSPKEIKGIIMIKFKCALLIFAIGLSSSLAQDRPTANMEDVATIDGVMKAYYEGVSGHPGKRDGERILSLFIPNGKIKIATDVDVPTHQLAEEYLRTESFLEISTDFFEREISRDTLQFGDMAQVMSTYGISNAMENTNYTARGVTVFQLIFHNDRWWILSTMWQRESDDFPIPADMLD